MLAFTRATLATAERELRRAIENLRVPVEAECTLSEAATRTHYALREAENALQYLQDAVALDDNLEMLERIAARNGAANVAHPSVATAVVRTPTAHEELGRSEYTGREETSG